MASGGNPKAAHAAVGKAETSWFGPVSAVELIPSAERCRLSWEHANLPAADSEFWQLRIVLPADGQLVAVLDHGDNDGLPPAAFLPFVLRPAEDNGSDLDR